MLESSFYIKLTQKFLILFCGVRCYTKIRFVCLLYRNGAHSFDIHHSRGMRDISKESQTGMLISAVNFHFLKWVTHDVANLL
jgi:hypothetical protein